MLCRSAAVSFCVVALLCSGYGMGAGVPPSQGVPSGGGDAVESLYQDLPILVPNVKPINKDILTEIGAEKFLSLWEFFVLSAEVVISDEPCTLLIPLNKGLPTHASFLTDREFTRQVLLNHVLLGDIVNLEAASSAAPPYYSLADNELSFSKDDAGNVMVNGVRLTGQKFIFDNLVVYIIESGIPLSQPEFLKFVPVTEQIERSGPIVSDIISFVTRDVEPTTEPSLDSNVPLGDMRVNFNGNAVSKDVPGPTSRPTRFDKFRKSKNEVLTSVSGATTEKALSIQKSIVSKNTVNSPPDGVASIADTKQQLPDTTSKNTVNSSPDDVASVADTKQQISDAISKNTVNSYPDSLANLTDAKQPLPDVLPKITTNSTSDEAANLAETKQPVSDIEPDVEVLEMTDVGEFSEIKQRLSFNTTFLSSMLLELNKEHSHGTEFIHHFLDADLGKFLSPDRNYTAIIPTNEAFYNYYPIDWGFNPFLVQNFTKDVLLNHILEGDIHLYEFNDDVEIHTIADRVIKVVKDRAGTVLVNGHRMPIETEVEIQNGRLYFIHNLLFVDYQRVNELRLEYPFLETAPLLSFPWPSSPFLSHLLKRLQEAQNTKIFAHLLRNSDIAHLVLSSDDNLNRLSYTVFVPSDAALQKTFKLEDLATLDPKIINDFLLAHIVSGYLLEEDFENGFNLISLKNEVIPITINNSDIYVGDSKLRLPQDYIYNLGALYMIEKPLEDVVTTTQPPLNKITKLQGNDIPLPNLKAQLEINNKVDTPFVTPLPRKEAQTGAPPVSMATPHPDIVYEVRTEISFSRQINDGEIVPVSRDVIEKARLL